MHMCPAERLGVVKCHIGCYRLGKTYGLQNREELSWKKQPGITIFNENSTELRKKQHSELCGQIHIQGSISASTQKPWIDATPPQNIDIFG